MVLLKPKLNFDIETETVELVRQPCASYRSRHLKFSTFFTLQDRLCYCHDVTGLFNAIWISCNPQDWRLFIDSSSRSLKAVLLHNGNQLPSLPVAHSAHLKEEYNSVKFLLQALKYEQYDWEVIGDFKMIAFLMGLQGGFTQVLMLSLFLGKQIN